MIKKVRSHHKFMLSYLLALAKILIRPAMIFLFFLSTTLTTICSMIFHYFESLVNPKITQLFDSFYYIVTIVTGVGLGDIVPYTTEGRIISMIVMIIGTGIYISLMAVVATSILTIEQSNSLK